MLKSLIYSLISFLLVIPVLAKEIEETFDGAKITLTFTSGATKESGATKDKVIGVKKQGTIHVLVPHHAQRFYDPDADRKYEFTVTHQLLEGWELDGDDAEMIATPKEYVVNKRPSADKIADATKKPIYTLKLKKKIAVESGSNDNSSEAKYDYAVYKIILYTPSISLTLHAPSTHGGNDKILKRPTTEEADTVGDFDTGYLGVMLRNEDNDDGKIPDSDKPDPRDNDDKVVGSKDDDLVAVLMELNVPDGMPYELKILTQVNLLLEKSTDKQIRVFDTGKSEVKLDDLSKPKNLTEAGGDKHLGELIDKGKATIYLEGLGSSEKPSEPRWGDEVDQVTLCLTPAGEYKEASSHGLLLPVDLAVDANRNGDVEFGIDKTSAATPYRFWTNNDGDVSEDEEESAEDPDQADNVIKTTRDLEDFARLQLMVGGLHEQLKSGAIQVSMKFKDGTVEGDPAINLWLHLDADGDRAYLLDEQIAARHLTLGNPGRITKNAGYTFPPSFWTGEGISNYSSITSEKPYRYLLFEGAEEGKGELVLEFKKGDEVIGEGSSCWLNILSVRKMYERVKITPDDPDDFTEPSDFVGVFNNPTITPPVPNIGWTWDPFGNNFVPDPQETKEYLVFVHGWRMTYHGSQKYAETMFKRLWQSGYKGRFTFVRWPTYSEDTHPTTNGLFTYNASDYRAWLSGKGVASFVNSLPSNYVRNITAHSMGNVVVSSAIREGMQVENYALFNAAMPAMCYDGRQVLYEFDRETPDGDADPITKSLGFKEKISNTNGARLINFYLEDDSALTGTFSAPGIGEVGGWEDNNKNFKPESFNLGTTGYDYDPDRAAGTKVYITFLLDFGRHLRSFHESAAYATASRTKTVGADGRTAGVINDKVDMDAKYGFDSTHSAEWQWRFQKTDRFYHDLMEKLNLNPIP